MSTAATMLQLYLDAEAAILAGQTIEFGGKRITLADLESVQKGRMEWERKVAAERRGAGPAVVRFGGACGPEGSERCWGRNT